MNSGIFELAFLIVLSAGLGILAKIFRQPLIIAYLISGIIISYTGIINANNETFRLFSDLGIVFLLFLIGLEINYDSLRMIGKPAIILGLGQIIFTFVGGFFIAKFLGFNSIASSYISIALTFSSTIIIVKLLSEKRDISSFYGKLSVGFLLVQDLVAILILIFLTGIETGEVNQNIIIGKTILTILKGIIIFSLILYLGRKFVPYIFDKVARSQELLFLISLAWLFLMVAIVKKLGLSIEIAGFLAGLSLANSSENFQISSKLKPLRDFFIMIFFIVLGSSFSLSKIQGIGLEIIIFSLFVLIGNPLIVLILMGILGYKKRTSFLTGLTVAQISEFSLILALMGQKLGHLNESEVGLITGVGIITITLSTYLILNSDLIFRRISKYLSVFERKKILEDKNFAVEYKKPIILIGAHRTGQSIALNINPKNLLIIDFDPDIISFLRQKNIDYIFGDIADPDVFEKANMQEAKIIISTSPDFNDNMTLLQEIKKLEQKPKIILRAETEKDALILYEKGADYVLLPNFTAGQYLGKTLSIDPEIKILDQLKKQDLEFLKKNKIR
jgi:Kef-type K+ transport system membrane component KefB/voltage-gated potassium channel Kch